MSSSVLAGLLKLAELWRRESFGLGVELSGLSTAQMLGSLQSIRFAIAARSVSDFGFGSGPELSLKISSSKILL